MPTTSPDNIHYPASNNLVAPLETNFATTASSVQDAFDKRQVYTFHGTNVGSLPTTGVRKGDMAFLSGPERYYTWNGSSWVDILAQESKKPYGIFKFTGSTRNIPASTYTTITWVNGASERYGMTYNTSGPYIDKAGMYLVTGYVAVNLPSNPSYFMARIVLDGTAEYTNQSGTTSSWNRNTVSGIVKCAVGQQISFEVYQSSSGTGTVSAGNCLMTIHYLGDY